MKRQSELERAYSKICKHAEEADMLLYEVLNVLDNMTTEDFSRGMDREIRLKVRNLLGMDDE